MKIRVKFGKYGGLKFVGHLDIMRYFQKCMRRAKVDIRYTEGFSPHQVMSFAQPLGLGVTSDGEYMDIEVNSTDTSKKMIERINAVNVDEIRIYSYRLLADRAKTGMAIIAAADYEIRFRYGCPFDLRSAWEAFIAREQILIQRQTKSGLDETDIKQQIFDWRFLEDGIFLKLSCGSVKNLKPETVMESLYAFSGATLGPLDLILHRKELYAKVTDQDGKERFVPLEDMGTDITEPLEEDK